LRVTSNTSTDLRQAAEGHRPSAASRGVYEYVVLSAAGLFAIISLYFVGSIVWQAFPAIRHQGLYLLTGTSWVSGGATPALSKFGGLSMITGTIETSLIAIVIVVVVGTGTSLAINLLLPSWMRTIAATTVELLAAIPSVVYGVWGMLVLAPLVISTVGPFLNSLPGGNAVFGTVVAGQSLLLAGFVLAIMVLPTYVAISREVIGAVPHELIEASLSLGATRWQTIWKTILPTGRVGLLGAGALALGRALGETVAVVLVIGQVNQLNFRPLQPGVTLASWIASQWGEAIGSDQMNALFALGALLMAASLGVSFISTRLVSRQRSLVNR
jgi:phosphate transport system permease protein